MSLTKLNNNVTAINKGNTEKVNYFNNRKYFVIPKGKLGKKEKRILCIQQKFLGDLQNIVLAKLYYNQHLITFIPAFGCDIQV